jgi:hypothetical protein
MSTPLQDAANLANAQLSTGPRTDEGKAVSSLNGLTHGLTAKTVLLPGEDPEEFQRLNERMQRNFRTGSTAEEALVTELASLQWRLLRIPQLEGRILSAETPDYKTLDNIGLYASRLRRQFTTTLSDLLRAREVLKKERYDRLYKAALIHHADIVRKKPTSVHEFGFGCSTEQIEKYLDEVDALDFAKHTLRRRNITWPQRY